MQRSVSPSNRTAFQGTKEMQSSSSGEKKKKKRLVEWKQSDKVVNIPADFGKKLHLPEKNRKILTEIFEMSKLSFK